MKRLQPFRIWLAKLCLRKNYVKLFEPFAFEPIEPNVWSVYTNKARYWDVLSEDPCPVTYPFSFLFWRMSWKVPARPGVCWIPLLQTCSEASLVPNKCEDRISWSTLALLAALCAPQLNSAVDHAQLCPHWRGKKEREIKTGKRFSSF